ncbi:MAG: ribokinase [Candidatus Cloacimonadota bacterium]|nr:MAG: ribokinase [Candidatus Cloacimonadota bacterium]
MRFLGKSIVYLCLILCGITMVIPFIWMVSTSLKSELEVNKGHVGFIPIDDYDVYDENGTERTAKIVKPVGDSSYVHIFNHEGKIARAYDKVSNKLLSHKTEVNAHFENYKIAFQKVPFALYFANTLFVAFCVLIGVLITSSLAAYAFARMQFKGRDFIFYLFVSMMMVPQPVYLIPAYVLLNGLGWIDTYMALIIPWIANVFTIFMLRQNFKTIPQDLLDAAAIDGCGSFRILWQIILPLSKSVLTTSAIFSLIGSWNSFMWPLVVTNSKNLRVLQVGLSNFSQESSSQTTLLMAASTFSILPLLMVFLLGQKHIIKSYASSGLKG